MSLIHQIRRSPNQGSTNFSGAVLRNTPYHSVLRWIGYGAWIPCPNVKHGHSTVILYSIIYHGQFLDTTEISSAYHKLISNILQGLSFSACQNCLYDSYHSIFIKQASCQLGASWFKPLISTSCPKLFILNKFMKTNELTLLWFALSQSFIQWFLSSMWA